MSPSTPRPRRSSTVPAAPRRTPAPDTRDDRTPADGPEPLVDVAAFSGAARLLASMLAQGATLAALLYYFAWSRLLALYAFFGLDVKLVDVPKTDLVLTSATIATPALFYSLAAAGAGWLLITFAARPAAGHRRATLALAAVLLALGATSLAVGAGWLSHHEVRLYPPLLPASIAVGLALVFLGYRLARTTLTTLPEPPLGVVAAGVLAAAVSLFWAWALFAQIEGQKGAIQIAGSLRDRYEVTVYSKERLAIRGTGVSVTDLGRANAPYVVRYEGLRLLARSANGDLFLLPVGWDRARDRVFHLQVDDTVRLDYGV